MPVFFGVLGREVGQGHRSSQRGQLDALREAMCLGAGAVLSVGALLAGIGLPGLPQARPDGRSCAALMACPCAYGPGPHTLASSGVRGVFRPRQRPGRFWSQRAGSYTPAAPAAVPLPPSKRHFGAVSGACGHKYAVLAPGCA